MPSQGKYILRRMISTLILLIILPLLMASCISDNNTWSLQFKAEAPIGAQLQPVGEQEPHGLYRGSNLMARS